MTKNNQLKNLSIIKKNLIRALEPIAKANKKTKQDKDFFVKAKRMDASRGALPQQYLVYFLFCELLGYQNFGKFEKIAWAIPIDYKGKLYTIEYRKMGLGVFTTQSTTAETNTKEIVKIINDAIKVAVPYFDWVADKQVSESKLNVKNNCIELFGKYKYLKSLYLKKIKEAERKKGVVNKKTSKTKKVTIISCDFPEYKLLQDAGWLAISTVESFFSWTEHLFIHLAIIARNLCKGNKVAELASAEWSVKFKSAFDLNNQAVKCFYDDLVIIRRQLRNFIAHGSFGKNGEAFQFHSSVGAVPVLMPHRKGANKFALTGETIFNEKKVFESIDTFIEYLWTSEISPAMIYAQESDFPSILPYANDGTYASAMESEEKMRKFLDVLSYQFDNAANMDW